MFTFFWKLFKLRNYKLIYQPKLLYNEIFIIDIYKLVEQLKEKYIKYIQKSFDYYDKIRFITLYVIYDVFKSLKKTIKSKKFDTILLLGLSSYIAEQTFQSSFIYNDCNFQKELQELLIKCNELWDNEKQNLLELDFDSAYSYENAFSKHKSVIEISGIFSSYIYTGYYVKNTIHFFNCLLELHERSKSEYKNGLLNFQHIQQLKLVMNETEKRMIISTNKLDTSLNNISYNIQKAKWCFYSFLNYDSCKLLKSPCELDKTNYYKTKIDVKLHPKSVYDHYKNTKSPKKRSLSTPLVTTMFEGINYAIDLCPIASHTKGICNIMNELREYIHIFYSHNKSNIHIDNIPELLKQGEEKQENKKKLINIFFHFIDILLPFATTKKTFDVLYNLGSVDSDHNQATLLILHKWNNVDITKTQKYLNELLGDDMVYNIIEMNLIYFDEILLKQSYYDYIKK